MWIYFLSIRKEAFREIRAKKAEEKRITSHRVDGFF